MKFAAIYMRMSTDKQEHSIESQSSLILEYAENMKYAIYKKYIDEGISGRQAEKRPAFLQMIEDSQKGLFEVVLIYDSSRFARNLEQSLVYKSMLKRNGVSLLSITEPTLDDDTSLITDALLGAMNEMYSRKLSKNVRRGMQQKALRGEYLSAPPFGYQRPTSHKPLQKDPLKSEIVKELFERFDQGETILSLADSLHKRNILTRFGNPLEARTIRYILKNPAYIGYLRWTSDEKTICQKADHDSLVSESLFYRVQKKLNETPSKTRNYPRPSICHWLSGLFICKKCGHPFVYSKGYHGRKDRFRCGGYLKGTCPCSESFTVEEGEKIVFSFMQKLAFPTNRCYEKMTKTPSHSSKKEIQKINQAIKKAKQAYLFGIDTADEYAENKKLLINQLKFLNLTYNNADPSSCFINNCIDILKGDFKIEQKAILIRTFVKKVEVDSKIRKCNLILFT